MERALKVISFVFIAIAFFFLWRQDLDAVFVSGVLGAVCFFLGMRYEIEARRRQRDADQHSAENNEN